MHQMQQEQVHGSDGDMGEGMVDPGEEYEELGDMTEEEYRRLVAEEQARLAQQEEDGDEEAITEEYLGQLASSPGSRTRTMTQGSFMQMRTA